MRLPEAFVKRMEEDLGGGFAAYFSAMQQAPRRALRVNTLKIAPEVFRALADFSLTPVEELPESFYFPDTLAVGRLPLHAAGLFYVQEPSAQLPANLPDVRPGMRALDLCAAPGGKAGQLAARLGNSGLLVANEPSPERAAVLQFNLERLGVTNAVVSCMQPEALCAALPEAFDLVLADAPCSGEGMFRKDPGAIAAWSPEHVHACALRQRGILTCAQALLAPGGTLVYSTCTFSREENEDVVEALARAHPELTLDTMRRVYPQDGPGEGQFMALLRKRGDPKPFPPAGQRRRQDAKGARASVVLAPWRAFCENSLTQALPRPVKTLPDGRVYMPPEGELPALERLRILRSGLLLGTVRNGRFQPDHALYLGLPAGNFRQRVNLEGDALARFLAGEAIPCERTLCGWCAVCAQGYPLGFGKAVAGTLKNHLPKGLRIRPRA